MRHDYHNRLARAWAIGWAVPPSSRAFEGSGLAHPAAVAGRAELDATSIDQPTNRPVDLRTNKQTATGKRLQTMLALD